MKAVEEQKLAETEVRFADKHACCVVVASGGYPVSYEKGFPMEIGEMADNVDVFVAGAKLADGQLVTSGGRVLGVTAIADTLQEAIDDAYEGVSKIRFEKSFCRHDIGQRALAAQK